MQKNPQRGLNTAFNLARDGAPKKLAAPAPVVGQTRREAKGGHPLLPGTKRPLDDEPMAKKFLDGKSAPIHPGMGSKTISERGTDKGPDHGSAVLQEAGRLGK